MNYIRIDETGLVRRWGTCSHDAVFSDADGLTTVTGVAMDVGMSNRKVRYISGKFVDAGPLIDITYSMQRRGTYPSIGDQLDALFKAGVFPPEMAAKIQAVKAQYPKT